MTGRTAQNEIEAVGKKPRAVKLQFRIDLAKFSTETFKETVVGLFFAFYDTDGEKKFGARNPNKIIIILRFLFKAFFKNFFAFW